MHTYVLDYLHTRPHLHMAAHTIEVYISIYTYICLYFIDLNICMYLKYRWTKLSSNLENDGCKIRSHLSQFQTLAIAFSKCSFLNFGCTVTQLVNPWDFIKVWFPCHLSRGSDMLGLICALACGPLKDLHQILTYTMAGEHWFKPSPLHLFLLVSMANVHTFRT